MTLDYQGMIIARGIPISFQYSIKVTSELTNGIVLTLTEERLKDLLVLIQSIPIPQIDSNISRQVQVVCYNYYQIMDLIKPRTITK